ncbi:MULTISPECIES: hypothetical protein [Muribaculum]|jgi:hypothetical protein|uniref:Uncharacterized protein n=1 Tax=Muribaculum caecicola TaxID=3038144 RepID=A0AC61S7J6_9BACT|nr:MULTISPECIES: hypothetical protein [Muribaculum]THG54478.1 hypothetical protein E5990_02630 [Muribaculum caecicola]
MVEAEPTAAAPKISAALAAPFFVDTDLVSFNLLDEVVFSVSILSWYYFVSEAKLRLTVPPMQVFQYILVEVHVFFDEIQF